MKKAEVQKLHHGLYRIHWKHGEESLAAVGSMSNGDRWMAPINWITPGTDAIKYWHMVEKVEVLFRYARDTREKRT